MYNLIPCKSYKEKCYQMTKNNKNIAPGQLQYKVNRDDIINIKKIIPSQYNKKWIFAAHTKENLLRLTPNTKTGNANKWKIILIIKSKNRFHRGGICMKGVLQNKKRPNEFALMTSIDKEEIKTYPHRMIKSWDPNYKICQCKMIAPPIFWIEFKNRLLY